MVFLGCAAVVVAILTLLGFLYPENMRNVLDRLLNTVKPRPKGQRLAANWQKYMACRRVVFCKDILTTDGEINGKLAQNRVTLALVELISWRSSLQFGLVLFFFAYCGMSLFALITFVFGFAVIYPPHFAEAFHGLILVSRFIAFTSCIGIVLSVYLSLRFTFLTGLAYAVEKKLMAALAGQKTTVD
jgi:hypothetical protein